MYGQRRWGDESQESIELPPGLPPSYIIRVSRRPPAAVAAEENTSGASRGLPEEDSDSQTRGPLCR